MKVSVITSAYNRRDDLDICVDSILKSDYLDYELIVVDNASTDGTSEYLEKKYAKKIKLITLEENRLSAGGKNAGIEYASGDYLWFVDSDMIVPSSLMRRLVEVLDKNERIAEVGASIYYYSNPNRLWSVGATINLWTSMCRNIKLNNEKMQDVDVILCGYMIRSSVIHEVGLYDETIKFVYEESDLSYKIKKLGYQIKVINDNKIFHNIEEPENATNPLRGYNLETEDRAFLLARNRFVFMNRYANKFQNRVFRIIFAPLFRIYYVYLASHFGYKNIANAYKRGYREGKAEK